jgi:hypothetical protein
MSDPDFDTERKHLRLEEFFIGLLIRPWARDV